jgi:hypothetical protein
MKQRCLTIISLLCAFLAPALRAQTGVVEGKVLDGASGAGISGVTVYFGTDQGVHYEAITGDSGAFHIAGMKPGEYGSHFEKAGYLPYYSGQDPSGAAIRVGSGGDPVRVRIELSAPGSLRGRVLDPDGKPGNARVELDVMSQEAATDPEGRFMFTGIAPGEHTLLATPIKSRIAPQAETLRDVRTELVPTWFPAAIEPDQAQKIVLASGADVSDIEIRLQKTLVYRVGGLVLNAAGKPEPKVTVMLVSAKRRETLAGLVQRGEVAFFPLGVPAPALPVAPVHSAKAMDGVFEFPSVPAGDWRFVAWSQSSGPPSYTFASAFVGQDIDDLELRFAAPFQWKGSVEWLNSSPDQHPKLGVMLAAEDHWSMLGGASLDGTLRFDSVLPGEYRIVPPPGAAGNYYLSSVLLAGRDVLGQPVTLFPGSPPLRILYKPNAGTVHGQVGNCGKATVVLVPEQALAALTQDFGRFSSCGSEGEFSISSVRPGDFYMWALDTADPTKFTDPKILQKLVPNAVRVTVDEAATASVKLSVTRLPVSW